MPSASIVVTTSGLSAAFVLFGAMVLLLGAATTMLAHVEAFAKAGKTTRMERYGRIAAYVGALIAYTALVFELSSNLQTFGLITVGIVFLYLSALLIIARVLTVRHAGADEQTPDSPQTSTMTFQATLFQVQKITTTQSAPPTVRPTAHKKHP